MSREKIREVPQQTSMLGIHTVITRLVRRFGRDGQESHEKAGQAAQCKQGEAQGHFPEATWILVAALQPPALDGGDRSPCSPISS